MSDSATPFLSLARLLTVAALVIQHENTLYDRTPYHTSKLTGKQHVDDPPSSRNSQCIIDFLCTVLSHLRGPPINATVIGTSAHRRALVRLRTSAVSNRAYKKVLNFREHNAPSTEPSYYTHAATHHLQIQLNPICVPTKPIPRPSSFILITLSVGNLRERYDMTALRPS